MENIFFIAIIALSLLGWKQAKEIKNLWVRLERTVTILESLSVIVGKNKNITEAEFELVTAMLSGNVEKMNKAYEQKFGKPPNVTIN